MLGKRTNHRALRDVFTSFEMMNASSQNSVLADVLDEIFCTVVVGKNFRYYGKTELSSELTPLVDLGHVTREDDDVCGRRTNLLVFRGGNTSDVNERELERAQLDRSLDALDKFRREFGFVGHLARRCGFRIMIHGSLKPRAFAIRTSRDDVGIGRPGYSANGLFQTFAQTTFAGPRRTGENDLFHD